MCHPGIAGGLVLRAHCIGPHPLLGLALGAVLPLGLPLRHLRTGRCCLCTPAPSLARFPVCTLRAAFFHGQLLACMAGLGAELLGGQEREPHPFHVKLVEHKQHAQRQQHTGREPCGVLLHPLALQHELVARMDQRVRHRRLHEEGIRAPLCLSMQGHGRVRGQAVRCVCHLQGFGLPGLQGEALAVGHLEAAQMARRSPPLGRPSARQAQQQPSQPLGSVAHGLQ
mmetsp:Transcript_14670/g.41693  ORF Transcript_14670/g.41693 Transcript_14670/m.41693 type:complete len:226 (+) Transcript_14670:2349-3026(+)